MVSLGLVIFIFSLCKVANGSIWNYETISNYIEQQWTVTDTSFIDVNFEIFNIWSAPKDKRTYFYGKFDDLTIIGTERSMMLFNIIPYPDGNDWFENSVLYFTGSIGTKVIWKYSLISFNMISWLIPTSDIVLNKIILKMIDDSNIYASITSANLNLLCKINYEAFESFSSTCIKIEYKSIFSIVPISNTSVL